MSPTNLSQPRRALSSSSLVAAKQGCDCGGMPQEAAAISRGRFRILCVGDSLTEGRWRDVDASSPQVASFNVASYANVLQGLIDARHPATCRVSLHARTGACVADIRRALEALLAVHGGWDLVCIMIGTNDHYARGHGRRIPSVEEEENLANDIFALHRICHSFGARTMMLLPPLARFKGGGGDAEMCKEEARRNYSVRTSFLYEHLCLRARAAKGWVLLLADPAVLVPLKERRFRATDGLHFTAAGSRALAIALFPFVSALVRAHQQRLDASATSSYS